MEEFSNRWTPWLAGLAILNVLLGLLQISLGIAGWAGLALTTTGIACCGVGASLFAVVSRQNRNPLLSYDGEKLRVVDASEGWGYRPTTFDPEALFGFESRSRDGISSSTYVLSFEASDGSPREVEIPVLAIAPERRTEFETLVRRLSGHDGSGSG